MQLKSFPAPFISLVLFSSIRTFHQTDQLWLHLPEKMRGPDGRGKNGTLNVRRSGVRGSMVWEKTWNFSVLWAIQIFSKAFDGCIELSVWWVLCKANGTFYGEQSSGLRCCFHISLPSNTRKRNNISAPGIMGSIEYPRLSTKHPFSHRVYTWLPTCTRKWRQSVVQGWAISAAF